MNFKKSCQIFIHPPLVLLVIMITLGSTFLGAQTESNVDFLGPDRSEKMDVWLPPKSFPRPVPAVLLIHGGGWRIGDKAAAREKNFATTLNAAGIAAFSINYLLQKVSKDAQGNDVPTKVWPQNFYDCKSALRFIKKESVRFGIRPDKIAVMGGSAGGHLSLLVGMTSKNPEMNAGGLYTDQNNDVVCIVDFYGIPDVRKFGIDCFAGNTPEESEQNYTKASPITYLSKQTTPPILVTHGTADKTVLVELSRVFVSQLKEAGVSHEYIEIPGAPHSYDLQPAMMDLRSPILSFLKKNFDSN